MQQTFTLENRELEKSEVKNPFLGFLHRAILFSIFLLALSAPHSIAATQIGWSLGLLLWTICLIIRPRSELHRTPVDLFLLGLFALTLVSALFSYDPDISIGKLRSASLFTICYLVSQNIKSLKVARLLILALIISCSVSTIYTVIERGLGQGIKISGLSTSSPLERVGVRAGDTILEINGKAVNDPSMLELAYGPEPRIKIYRYELIQVLEPESIELLPGQTPVQRLGIERWQRGRDWRASGFYGHYATYAEVLQLIGSLVIGLLVASSGLKRRVLLSLVAALFLISLLFTITRAAWASFLISSLLILSLSMGRRFLLLLPIILIPVVAAGLFILQQKRNVGFFDRKDGSIQWRETVYREGLELLISNPRHMVTGIGMDSIKRRWREWGLFDNGRLPIGHMHSTPLQVALERGLPALLCWLGLLFVYIRLLMHTLKRKSLHWIEKGTILGAIGGTAGFFLSGIVHYNLGDSEVMMVFYLIMGICLVIYRERKDLTVHSP